MPIKPLSFKGDKKSSSKKRKHRSDPNDTSNTNPADHPSTTEDDDTWVTPDAPSDITGPTILILPTIPPTALASDANGNVFASPLENIIEGHAETAEPHDVRQVWVANQIPGTLHGQVVSFRASHGGFLSCDTTGVLGARREARGFEEGFGAVKRDGERWGLTAASAEGEKKEAEEGGADGGTGERYLAAVTEGAAKDEDGDEEEKSTQAKKVSISLRGDGEAEDKSTGLIIKMQARFKPKLQQEKDTKAREKVSKQELEHAVGRKLEDDEVRRLKKARKNGTYHEEILDVRVKGKHDKYA